MTHGLDLIDWKPVGFSALWILGLSLILATFSLAWYAGQEAGVRTRDVLKSYVYSIGFNAGSTLFCLGLLGTVKAWWGMVIWALFALAFSYRSCQAIRARRASAPDRKMPDGYRGEAPPRLQRENGSQAG